MNQKAKIMVSKSILINAPLDHTFDVFVNNHNLWWPRSHHIGKVESFEAFIEPKVGGRWYEKGSDGSECNWGKVLAFEPPTRLVLSWDINAKWQYDPEIANEVEVRFSSPQPGQTLVELEHRKIERFGEAAEAMRLVFDSDCGWPGVLAALATQVEAKRH